MHPPKTRPDDPARVAPMMPLALAVAAGIVADRFAEPWGTGTWAVCGAAGSLLALLSARRRWVGSLLILTAVVATAGAWHHWRWSDVAADDLSRAVDETPRPVWLRGVIRDGLGFRPGKSPGDAGNTRLVLDVTGVKTAEGWRTASGRATMTVGGDRSDLIAGDAVEAAGSLARIAGPLNPGEFDYQSALRAQGVRLRLGVDDAGGVWPDASPGADGFDPARAARKALGAVRRWSRERLIQGLDPESAPLAAALLLGRREGVDPEVNDAFARTGTTHLLAISGLHMQVLALALGFGLRVLGIRRKPTFAAVGAATLAYMALVGLMPSVVRSAAMTLAYCTSGLFDRCGGAANTLAMAALITLGCNPSDLFDVGCQLSFLAVAAIVWGAVPLATWVTRGRGLAPLTAVERRFEPGWKGFLRGIGNWVAQGAIVSTVVWLAALPLVALRFHLVSPIGVALNLPLIPLTSAALMFSGASLGFSAVYAPLGMPFAWVAGLLLRWTESAVRWGVAVPGGHAFVPGPSWEWVLGFYAVLGFAAVSVRRWRRPGPKGVAVLAAGWAASGLALTFAPGVLTRPVGSPVVEVLAVGHGLAVVIETGGGRAVVYDCGRMRDPSVGRRIVAPALWARGITRVDAVILSHADADHYNGLPDLLDRVPVSAVLVPPAFAGPSNPDAAKLLDLVRSRGVPVRTISSGDGWSFGATRFDVRHPPLDMNPSAPDNARSVVLDVSWRGRHTLLTGDLDGEGLASVVSKPAIGPIDVLLSPHHGGRTANPARLYSWASPKVVIVSQKAPMPGSRDALKGLKPPTLRTWEGGAIRLRWTPDGKLVWEGFHLYFPQLSSCRPLSGIE